VIEQAVVAATVLCVAEDDAMAMIGALADPVVLLVFGVIVAGRRRRGWWTTSGGRRRERRI